MKSSGSTQEWVGDWSGGMKWVVKLIGSEVRREGVSGGVQWSGKQALLNSNLMCKLGSVSTRLFYRTVHLITFSLDNLSQSPSEAIMTTSSSVSLLFDKSNFRTCKKVSLLESECVNWTTSMMVTSSNKKQSSPGRPKLSPPD